MTTEPFSSWAILELMGHRRLIGHVSEQEMAGTRVFRIDVPEANGTAAYTQFYGGASVYCLSPVTETVARAMLSHTNTTPWFAYDLPQLPSPDDQELF